MQELVCEKDEIARFLSRIWETICRSGRKPFLRKCNSPVTIYLSTLTTTRAAATSFNIAWDDAFNYLF